MKNMNNETYLKYLEMMKENKLSLKKVPPEYQTEEICIEAIKKNPIALQFVKEQTSKLCLEAVRRDGNALQYVKEQTLEICLAAVKQNGFALSYVKEQTPEICLEAVKQNGGALNYVKERTPEICLEAVKQNGYALQYVKEQTPGICLEAVKQNDFALGYVKDQTLEICLKAVKQDGYALSFVKEQTPEICLEAVKQNGYALAYVKDQTPEICLEAVEQNYLALSCIKDKELAKKIENELIESKLFKETNVYRAFITDGIDCDSSYISPKDNIERPATIVLNTKCNSITISFNDNEAKCNTKEILDSLDDYNIKVCDNNYVIIDLDGLSDDKISELFTDTIMKVDEFVRENYDLSKNIKDKNAKNIDDMEL